MKPLTKFEKLRVTYWITGWLFDPVRYDDKHMTTVLKQVRDDPSSVRIIRIARNILRLSREC